MKDIAENTVSFRIAYDLIKEESWARVRLGHDLSDGPNLLVPVSPWNLLEFPRILDPFQEDTKV
jgi:hypothetical protein